MKPNPRFRLLFPILVGTVLSLATVRGQTVIGTSPSFGPSLGSGTSGGFSISGTAPLHPLSSIASALGTPGPLWQAGPLALRPHLRYDVVRGNGILRVPGSEETTTIQTVSPGILVELGTRTTADYTLSRKIYSSATLPDTTDHNARLQTGAVLDQWRLTLAGNYGSNSDTLVQTGGQTRDETYATSANIAHPLGARLEIEVNLSHSVRSATPTIETVLWNGSDWTLWAASAWLRYYVSKRLSVAAGVAAGYDAIEDAPDMSHTQPQVQVTWMPTPRLSFNAEVGLERRRTRATVGRTEENARYTASASYSPFATTTLSLGASRSTEPAYFDRQTTQSDGWNVGFRQRLLTKIFFSADASQRRSNYESTAANLTINRDDRYDSLTFRLSTPVVRKGSVAVFYQRGRNRSNEAVYQFTSDQVGAEIGYRF